MICQTITQTLTSRMTSTTHLCACSVQRCTARRKKYVDYDKNLNLVLVVDVGSCLQQSLNCLSMSLLGSYPQRNTAWFLHDEGERERERERERDCELLGSALSGE